MPHAEINVPGLILVGRFSGDPHWPVLGDPRGDELLLTAARLIEHAETLKAQAAELKKQIVRLEREASTQSRKKA